MLCSDGVWDLWEYDAAFASLVEPPPRAARAPQGTEVAAAFFAECEAKGRDMFDSSADNMTGIVVYLGEADRASGRSPKSTGGLAPLGGSAAASPKSESAVSPNSFFSV